MIRRALIAATVALWSASAPVQAQDICAAVVNGELLRFDRETFLPDTAEITRRERLLAWPGRTWDGLRGREPACDSQTVITFLGQTVPADEIDGYCLSEVGDFGFLLIPGERNFRGRCTGGVCEAVNNSADTAKSVTGTAARTLADKATDPETLGGLVHSSGAAMLSGQVGAVTGALGSVGSGLAAALSAPAVLAATAVTVVAVGGAVYVCRD